MSVPILSIILAWMLIYVPRLTVAHAQWEAPGGYDNRHPRQQQASLNDRARRANAAHYNSFEAFSPFAFATLLCLLTAPNNNWVSLLCLVFVVARILYIQAYVSDLATVRTVIWTVGFISTGGLFFVALQGAVAQI